MSNHNDSTTGSNREENMSQLTGKPSTGAGNKTSGANQVATHSLADVASARSSKVGAPTVGSTGLEAKIFMLGLVRSMF
jgi:phosphate transport system ATP-binding protein